MHAWSGGKYISNSHFTKVCTRCIVTVVQLDIENTFIKEESNCVPIYDLKR